jgi:acyl-CoA reductase-like NAD-dependent aldehyde dehydrogenase
LASQELGLELRVEGGRLRLVNPATGARLLTPAEAQAAWRAEAAARQAEAASRCAAEAEVERLRAELERRRGEPSQG